MFKSSSTRRWEDEVLSHQACWFIYGKHSATMAQFRCPLFRQMLSAPATAKGGGGSGSGSGSGSGPGNNNREVPFLTLPALDKYIEAEYNVMKWFLLEIFGEKWLEGKEKVAMWLDPRVKRNLHVMDKASWIEAESIFRSTYIDFYCTCRAFDREHRIVDPEVVAEEEGKKTSSANLPFSSSSLQISRSPAAVTIAGAGVWSDDSDSDLEIIDELTAAQIAMKDREEGAVEFDAIIKKWKRYNPNWKMLYPEELGWKEGGSALIDVADLMGLDVKQMMDQLEEDNADNKFGYIPLMMGCSIGQLGALEAERFVERVNSVGKLVVPVDERKTTGRLQATSRIDKLITLRMNTEFMNFMRLQNNPRAQNIVVLGLSEINAEENNEDVTC